MSDHSSPLRVVDEGPYRRRSPFVERHQPSIDGVELKHLRAALVAADLHSFSKAAAYLRIKQATLSQHISYLEQRFGAVLFRRSPRGVVPTDAGEIFLGSARRVLDEMEGLYEKTRAVSLGGAGTMAIGFVTSITAGNLRSSLFAFQDEFGAIQVRGVEDERHRLLAKLDTGSLDVLIISGTAVYPNISGLNLWSERMFIALPHTHSLAQRERIYWSDLYGETFLAPKTTADDIQAMVQMRLAQPGKEPQVVVADVSRETVLGAVGGGRAITLISAGSSGMAIDNVVLRPLFDATGPHILNFSAYWRDDNSNPALRTFLQFLRERYSLSSERG